MLKHVTLLALLVAGIPAKHHGHHVLDHPELVPRHHVIPEGFTEREQGSAEIEPALIDERGNATNGVSVGDRVNGGDVATVWTYMAIVWHAPSDSYAGPAAVINSRWALCSTQILPGGVVASDLRMYTKSRSTSWGDRATGKKYRVKELRVHPEKEYYRNSMVLMRSCPAFPSWVTLPPASKMYDVGYTATFMNYLPSQKFNLKAFAEFCECDEQPGWDPSRQVCLVESPWYYNADNEKGSLLFVDYVFAGINTVQSNEGGEPYMSIAKYLTWLSNNTPLS